MNNFIDGTLLTFLATDKTKLNGFLIKSKPKNKKLIIHLHGMGGNFYWNDFIKPISDKLKGTNFDFLTINTRGHGYITKVYQNNKKKTIGVAHEKFEECVYDIQGAIKLGKKLGYKEFILSGHSTGCQKIIYYQSKKQNKKVKALLLMGPGDDYSTDKKEKGINFSKAVKYAKKLVKNGKGDQILPEHISKYSAKRYLSFSDEKNTEAQILNYSKELKLFSKIKIPMLAVFGKEDHYIVDSAEESFEKLRIKTNSEFLETVIIPKADHGFKGQEKKLAKLIFDFLKFIEN